MKKKSSTKVFKTTKEMDDYLENQDLGEIFQKKGLFKSSGLKKINLDLPQEVIQQIDQVALKIGVSRQPLLKMWIHQMLKQEMTR
ncbi:MAG: hypothetical protein JNK65_08735 [Deltaproteobacteria bacterium]|nr:hypothetical protein [Deltaproteobacteria bacterium]